MTGKPRPYVLAGKCFDARSLLEIATSPNTPHPWIAARWMPKSSFRWDRPARLSKQAEFARQRRAQAGKASSLRSELAFGHKRGWQFSLKMRPAVAASSRVSETADAISAHEGEQRYDQRTLPWCNQCVKLDDNQDLALIQPNCGRDLSLTCYPLRFRGDD